MQSTPFSWQRSRRPDMTAYAQTAFAVFTRKPCPPSREGLDMANGFANKAGRSDQALDDELAAELDAAGIEVHRYDFLKNGRSEVDTAIVGTLHGWKFERAWYYWRAAGPGIEVAAAEWLHAEHGRDVRVDGHCDCPSPREWFKGLAVGSYHVDTPASLKALADTIKELVATPKDHHRDGAVEHVARALVKSRGASVVSSEKAWPKALDDYKKLCKEFPGYARGKGLLPDAFRDAHAAVGALTVDDLRALLSARENQHGG